MHISFNTSPSGLNLNTGYGLAGYGIVTAMQRVGHTVGYKDSSAKVELAFCMPDASDWSNPDAYHIQMTPWESTKLPWGWIENFNLADEVWATSQWVADLYKREGVTVPIRVYEHGIDPMWTPRRRRRADGPIKFLHVGEPAPRKGGQMALEAFHDAFGDSRDVHLTIKAWTNSTVRVYDRKHVSILGQPQDLYNNVKTRYDDCSEAEMVYIFHRHDALVYPSMGEGFGLIPLQALGTGMVTICTEAWAPYKRFLEPELSLGSTLVDSQWETMHPGKFYLPDYDDLKSAYLYTAENFNRLAGRAYRNSFKVHKEYDWSVLTNNALQHIVDEFG